MPNSDSSIPQAHENESLRQVAEKFLESAEGGLNIVDGEGKVVGKITSRSLILALANNVDPNTPVKTLVEEQIEMTHIENNQDIPLANDSNVLNPILEASSDGVLISDNQGNITYVNSAYEQITGLKKEQMIGQNLQKLLDEKLFNIAASLIVLKDGNPVSIMHKYITGKNALTTASPIYNEQGEIIGVFNNTRNISGLAMLRNELVGTNNHIPLHYFNKSQDIIQQQMLSQGFVFKSKIMMQVLELASKAAHYDSTVLIYGESGSGKEVLAKFIHQQSPRREGPFIKLNCAAIPDELFESELFGYEPGSFTGANRQGKPGMLELANQGTILLDNFEKNIIIATLKNHSSMRQAATDLGINVSTLSRKMKKYRIET